MSFGGGSSGGSIRTGSDVALSNPADGQVLAYSASLQKWQNQAPTGVSSSVGSVITTVTASGGDDTAAVQAALSAGDVLLLSNGTPFHISYIAYVATSSRRIFSLAPITIIQTNAQGVFSLRGGWDSLGAVSSIATVSGVDLVHPGEATNSSTKTTVSQLTMSAAATVTRSDIVKIVSDDLNPWGRPSSGSSAARAGEYSTIGIDSSSTTITLSNVLIESYSSNIKLVRLQDICFRIEGPITFDTDPSIRDTAIFGAVIELRAARFCYIGGGVKLLNSVGRAIGNYAYATHVDGVTFHNLANRPSKSQYGYGVQDGGWELRMTGCHGERLRHMYSEGANVVPAGSTNYEYFGGGFFALVTDCTAMNCEGQAYDTHGTAYGATFVGCKAYGSFVGASSGGGGYASRGRYTTFRNCEADGCFRGFGVGGYSTSVIDCRALRCAYSALEIGIDTADSTQQTTQLGHEIIGGLYETNGASRTFVFASVANYTNGAYLESVCFRPVNPNNGHSVMELGGSASQTNTTCKLQFKNVRIDYTRTVAGVGSSAVYVESDSIYVRGKGLKIDADGSSLTGVTIITGAGSNAGYAADIEVDEIVWDSSSLNPTVVSSSMTATRYSSYVRSSSAGNWYSQGYSADTSVASSAGATLPISRLLDRSISCRITGGSNSNVTFSTIPATPRQNGAQLAVINRSTDTLSLNSVTIAPNAAARWLYSGGGWVAA